MKALVVDDSAVMRKVLITALNRAGITDVDQAADGQQALVMVNGAEYDAVLLDWNMPTLSGLDALKSIRASGKTFPIIMVATEAEKDLVLEALKAGANHYIIKPFEPAALVSAIQEVLAK